jgi:hypothetical protein
MTVTVIVMLDKVTAVTLVTLSNEREEQTDGQFPGRTMQIAIVSSQLKSPQPCRSHRYP